MEDTDLIVLWGSNARETHPIFFHHVLQGVRNGAKLIVVDPRRTASARFADAWLGLDVGTDIALANTVAREILAAGLENRVFLEQATTGFEEFAASVEPWTLERGAAETGVPAEAIRHLAHSYARAERAQLCWTLGITEHHNAVDNVLALINLSLLCGHVGRYGSGLNPLRGQNNVQGGGDMGAIPNRLPGFGDILDDEVRARFDAEWGSQIPPRYGMHLTQMFAAMERRELTALYVIGENPAQSEADVAHAIHLLEGLDHLVVQDIFFTKTAQMADVVLPASAAWCETEGTVTSSERRVQRVRKAIEAPEGARDDVDILCDARRPPRPRLALRIGRGRVGRAAFAVAAAPGDELAPPRRAGRHPVALPVGGFPGAVVSARPALGRRPRRAGPPGAVLRGGARAARRRADRGVPLPAHHRPPPRLLQHRRAERQLRLAAAEGRDARPLPQGRRRPRRRRGGRRAGRLPARFGDGTRPPRPGSPTGPRVHDLPLSRPGRREPADHRGHRPQVGDGRVQGHPPCGSNR